jgi:predicted homoserine dehydrogenase-like protein
MQLNEHLLKREAAGNPIKVGLVGCGQEGSGMMHITRQMPGMETVAIADIVASRPLNALQSMGIEAGRICVTNNAGEAQDALARGKYVVTEDAMLLPQLDLVDALVEATGVTEVGARVAWNGILNKKHVVMLNVETDVTVGLFLHKLAQKTGCVYTAAMGDEPGVCKTLYNFATTLGFEVVCLGKGKNNPVDYYANPDSCRAEAESKQMNPKMLAAFKDGTKTMVELAAMSNATGLVPDVPGTHAPCVDIPDLNKVFIPQADGGILSQRGCVDFSVGKVAPGVFAIIATDDPRIVQDMKFYSMGNGPYYTLLRPYHLCSIETPLSIAEAVIYGEATLAPRKLVSEVVAIAKRDLKAGQTVDDIGGYDFFNRLYKYEEAAAARGIPMGLAGHGVVLADIAAGEMMTTANFPPDTSTLVYKMRQMQDDMLGVTR